MRFCLDPGHTGISDPGAVGAGGTFESTAALDVAKYLCDWLVERGHEVMLTREVPDDSVDELSVRVALAIDWAADVFISIHCNAFSDPRAHGFEVWTTRGQTESDVLATEVYSSMQMCFPDLTGRADYSDGDPDKEAGFGVLKGPFPSILVELAFISNPVEEGILGDALRQRMFAEAIGTGLLNWGALR